MSDMKTLGQRGALNILLIPFILVALLFVGAIGFGFWAFAERGDYKDKSDQKVAAAVVKAKEQTQAEDAAKYAEEAKKPFDTWIGPSAFGNITVKFPKTWSAYIEEDEDGGQPIAGWLYPNVVPDTQDQDNAFALRIELVQQSYDTVINQFSAQVEAGQVTVAPYKLPKVPSIVGSRVEGQIKPTKRGTMIVLPLRNMTLEIWTESNSFKKDLDENILPNLSFVP